MFTYGADFSSAQDTATVEAAIAKIAFGIVKATEGIRYESPALSWQVSMLAKAKKHVGLYHFLRHDVSGVAQWDYFESIAGGLARVHACIIACDHEPDENGVTPADAIARAFIARGRQRGFIVGRYGSAGGTMRYKLGESWRWVAQWSKTPPHGYDLWQYHVSPTPPQDWNAYAGTPAQLAAWWAKHSAHVHAHAPLPSRWWLEDETTRHSLGPMKLAAVGPRVAAYVARHPKSRTFVLVKK